MHLIRRIEQILTHLRPAFGRQATWEWFVLIVWGILLCTRTPAITSYLNAVGLTEFYYTQALHWFHSTAWSAQKLATIWHEWLLTHEAIYRLKGEPVYVGDGIKVSKEGRKMPGVKTLHQESENVNKPKWIRGHYFGAISLLMKSGSSQYATPVILELQDGMKKDDSEKITLVDKMAQLCVRFLLPGSYIILDAYFASKKLIKQFRQHQLNLITRVKINTVGKHPLPPPPPKRPRGKPRTWGEVVKLRNLFNERDSFSRETILLYGKMVTVSYRTLDLHWDSPEHLVRFVLGVWPEGKQIILLSTDVSLSGSEILTAYSWRFKIEVTFRTLIELLSGFSYRFWMKNMAPLPRQLQDLILNQHEVQEQQQFQRKVEAYSRFVNVNAIALGILQLLSLEMPTFIWQRFPGWFRTLPKNGYPSELSRSTHSSGSWTLYFSQKSIRPTFDKILKRAIAPGEQTSNRALCLSIVIV